jgi:hypothetical protein
VRVHVEPDLVVPGTHHVDVTPWEPPARSGPADVDLPRGLLVSIEAIAVLPA